MERKKEENAEFMCQNLKRLTMCSTVSQFHPTLICLIFFVYVSWWTLVVFPWFWWTSAVGFLNIILFNFITLSVLVNYYHSCTTDPGEPPKGWIPEGATEEEVENAKKVPHDPHNWSLVVWCAKCNNCKPKRTHHCRQCDKCVMKMDHHCPWINNCVGHFNHKYFVLFLFYASVGLSDALLLFLWRTIEIMTNPEENATLSILLLVINWAFVFPVTLGILFLLKHQISVVTRNTTTIEESIRKWQAIDAREAGQEYIWPFDYGTLGNVEAVLGKSWALWLFPTPAESDGIHWKISKSSLSV